MEFQEFELPPIPPGGTFDARSKSFRPGNGGCTGVADRGQGLSFDIRGSLTRTQVDTFQIIFQPGSGPPVKFSWDSSSIRLFCDSLKMRDQPPQLLTLNMFNTSRFVFDDSLADAAQVRIYMYGAPGVTLIAPVNGAVVPPSMVLSWNSRRAATKYRLQVSTDSLFGSMVFNDSTLVDTTHVLSGLPVPATYYWRVSAGNIIGYGAYSPVRHFTTGAIPSAPILLLPPDGATGQPTSLILRWNASSAAQTYHVQLSTDSNFVTTLVNDSTLTDTSRPVSGLQFSTRYYWHVRAKNGVGVGPFSSRFAFTTQFQPPPAPTLQSPPNGSTNMPLVLTLSWNPVGGATSYRLQVATNSSFTSIVVDDSLLTATSRSIGPLVNNTQYFWHVSATNPGGTGPYSTAWNFTTIVAAPPAPGLLSPADGATNVPLNALLTWNAASGATSYRVQVALDTAFAAVVFDDSTVTTTSRQTPQLAISTTYYWHVRGKNVGGIGPYSTRFSFTTTATPPPPALIYPADSSGTIPRSTAMVWARVPSATLYHVQLSLDAAFTVLLVSDSSIVDTFRFSPPLTYGSILHWRARAKNAAGWGSFSGGNVFTVMYEPPGATTQVTPANNATGQPVMLVFRWTTAILADWYRLDVARDTLMTNMFLTDSLIVDTSRTVSLAPNTAYFWRVRARNFEGSYGPSTPVHRFVTLNGPPAVPVTVYPANWDTNIVRLARLEWTGSPGALTYRVQVSLNPAFSQVVFDDSTIAATQTVTGLLQPFTRYYWHVRAKGFVYSSVYSTPGVFTTGLAVPVEQYPQPAVPSGFVLHQNYPNPFNPSTTVPFEIAGRAFVTLRVYDLLGREIRTLFNEDLPAGTYAVRWDGRGSAGQAMPTGVYLVRMTAVGPVGMSFGATRKLLMLK